MAHGLPIVGSAVGGIPSAVDGCGRLVAADAPAELAACLGTVAVMPSCDETSAQPAAPA
jgi:glycosyltransferase involved in cell wall biosynthesis